MNQDLQNKKIIDLYDERHTKFMKYFGNMFQVFQLKKENYSIKRQSKLLHVQPNDVIIDGGCGIGATAISLVKNYDCSIHAFNINDVHLKLARENIAKEKLEEKIFLYNEDYKNIDQHFKPNSIDKIYFIESLSYSALKGKKATLEKCYKLLKKDGIVFIQDFFFSEVNTLWNRLKKGHLKSKISKDVFYFIEDLIPFLQICEEIGFKIKYLNKMEITLSHIEELYGNTDILEENNTTDQDYHFFQLEPFEIILKK